MQRILLRDLHDHIDKEVSISGAIITVRDHSKIIFIDLKDRSGSVQCFMPQAHEHFEKARKLSPESVVHLQGIVKKRPEKNITEGENGDIEFVVNTMEVLAEAQELPFSLDAEVNIDTKFDYRPVTLRSPNDQALFRLQAHITQGFREYLTGQDFVEFQAPSIVGGDAEGGAEVFSVQYFDKEAALATSPQLYKQIAVGVFERAFCIGNVFRAEKHSTSRHLNEYTSMDFEMGYIKDHMDVARMLEGCIRHIIEKIEKEMTKEMEILGATVPTVSQEPFPVMKLAEAQKLLTEHYNNPCEGEPDLSPEHERLLCEHALKEHTSDFIFVTHYPTEKRPMYSYDDEEDPGFTKSFDLLFRGVEISSGGQRVHSYKMLLKKMKMKLPDIEPTEQFGFYLQAFKYGMPPHGGMGMGLERLTAKITGLPNAKEAAIFPRDRNRIDTRIYEQ